MSNCIYVNIKKGWNLISLSFYNQNIDVLTRDERIIEIKNMVHSYNINVPKEFNSLTEINTTNGYFINSREDFEIECKKYFIDYKNLFNEELEDIRDKINMEILDRRKSDKLDEQGKSITALPTTLVQQEKEIVKISQEVIEEKKEIVKINNIKPENIKLEDKTFQEAIEKQKNKKEEAILEMKEQVIKSIAETEKATRETEEKILKLEEEQLTIEIKTKELIQDKIQNQKKKLNMIEQLELETLGHLEVFKFDGKDYIDDKWCNIPERIQEQWKYLGWNEQLWDKRVDPYNRLSNTLFHDLSTDSKDIIISLGFNSYEWDSMVNHEISSRINMSNINLSNFNYEHVFSKGSLKEWFYTQGKLSYGRYSYKISKELLEMTVFNINCIPKEYPIVTNLDGIKFLKFLKKIIIYNSSIKDLDLYNNEVLEFISCSKTNIKTLDLTKNKNIQSIYCFDCQSLEYIDLRGVDIKNITDFNSINCPKLKMIYVDSIDNIPNTWKKDNNVPYVTDRINKIECPIVDNRDLDEKNYVWENNRFGPFYNLNDNEEYYLSIFNDTKNEELEYNKFLKEQIELNNNRFESNEGKILPELCEKPSLTQEEYFENIYSDGLKPFVTKDFHQKNSKNLFRTIHNNILSYDQIVTLAILKSPLTNINNNFYSMYYFDIFSDEYKELPNNYKTLFTQDDAFTTIINHNRIGSKIFRQLEKETIQENIYDLNLINFDINSQVNYKFNDRIISLSSLENISFLTNLNFMNPLLIEKTYNQSVQNIKNWTKNKIDYNPTLTLFGNNMKDNFNLFIFVRKIKN